MAIVGAGPCGLAAAHALAKVLPAGATIGLYERAPSIHIPRGAGLGLEVNGLRALKAIDASLFQQIMDKHSVAMKATEFKDPQVCSVLVF